MLTSMESVLYSSWKLESITWCINHKNMFLLCLRKKKRKNSLLFFQKIPLTRLMRLHPELPFKRSLYNHVFKSKWVSNLTHPTVRWGSPKLLWSLTCKYPKNVCCFSHESIQNINVFCSFPYRMIQLMWTCILFINKSFTETIIVNVQMQFLLSI